MNFNLAGGAKNEKDDKSKPKNVNKINKDWFDWWLSDDPPAPVAKQELRQARLKQANTYKSRGAESRTMVEHDSDKAPPTNVTININLSKLKVPTLKLPKAILSKIKMPAWPDKRLIVVAVGLVMIGVVANLIYKNHQKQVQTAKVEAAQQALASQPNRTSPSFTPVAPKIEPDLSKIKAGSKKTAYDGSRDAFSYTDNINANNIIVSEQPLPTNSGTAQQVVAKVANQISAKTPILLSGNNVAYLHSNDKAGSQTVVFSLNGLLIFINSAYHHGPESYKSYIENLQ